MAMRRIVQSLGSRTFKSIYAARLPQMDQQPSKPDTRPESLGGKATPHAKTDSYAPPQHRDLHEHQSQNWEQIKDDISSNRPGAQQSQQPWMEAAKEKLSAATEFVKEKTSNLNVAETAATIKDTAKEKLSQASEYLQSKTDASTKDMGAAAKEKFEDIKEGAKDKLAQAQEFVRKQASADSTKKVKDAAKEKYEDLKVSAEQKKKITEEAWDFSKLNKGSNLGKQNLAYGEKLPSDFAKKESNVAGESKVEAAGILNTVKETASNAAEWVKDKLTPSGSEKPTLNANTDEKVQAASEKLKSDLKANDDVIRKDYAGAKKNFSDDRIDKKY